MKEQYIMPFVICFLALVALVAMHYNPEHTAQILELISLVTGVVGTLRLANRDHSSGSAPPSEANSDSPPE